MGLTLVRTVILQSALLALPATAVAANAAATSASPVVTPDPFATVGSPLLPGSSEEKDWLVDEETGERYSPNIYRKFGISGGVAAYDKFTTSMSVSGDVAGAMVDFEDLLGIDESTTIARFDGHYSFNRRHRVDFSYYDIRRNGTRSIDEDIEFGDVVIPAGSVDSFFNTQIFKLAYRYNFVADTRTVIGASFGAHVMGIDAGISNDSFAVEETFRVAAPLPLIGMHGSYALSDTWSLNASIEFLQFDIDAYRGFISDSRLTIEHDTFEHFGWGLGFNGFKIDGNIEGDGDLEADLEYGYQGLMLYLRGYF